MKNQKIVHCHQTMVGTPSGAMPTFHRYANIHEMPATKAAKPTNIDKQTIQSIKIPLLESFTFSAT